MAAAFGDGLHSGFDSSAEVSEFEAVTPDGFLDESPEPAADHKRSSGRLEPLVSVDLPVSTLTKPSSLYQPFNPQTQACNFTSIPVAEAKALRALHEAEVHRVLPSRGHDTDDSEDEDEFYLDDFSVYVHAENRPYELVGPHELFKRGKSLMYFDGVLSQGKKSNKYRLHRVPIHELSIGNYGREHATVGGDIWVRSTQNKKTEIWYRLRKPAFEYGRYFRPVLWVADLGKHVVDFIEDMLSRGREVGIAQFRVEFADWLELEYPEDARVMSWLQQHPSRDFRNAVSVNAEFLWKETTGALNSLRFNPFKIRLFHETKEDFDQYRAHHRPEMTTVVTPYIYSLFEHLDCGFLLRRREPVDMKKDAQTGLEIKLQAPGSRVVRRDEMIAGIKPGDVVSTAPDGDGSGTKWRGRENLSTKWYGLVQRVDVTRRGSRLFQVTWLYQPNDTPCCTQKYPWPNELFLSDHCTCHCKGDLPLEPDDILGIHSVEFFGGHTTQSEFFVRQMYLVKQRCWVTLKQADLKCQDDAEENYEVGDTVLAGSPNTAFLEPYEITGFSKAQRGRGRDVVGLRKLLRRRDVDPSAPNAPKNELVYSDEIVSTSASWIHGRCVVRFFECPDKLFTPYDRRGAGNVFFITHRKVNSDDDDTAPSFVPMSAPERFRQGFQPSRGCKPLRGLDLFAGCGNLGRGLEEGGAVEVKWVNDIWDVAIHTYMANTKPGAVEPYLGSIDKLLDDALKGNYSRAVPAKGEVEFISGGSPCQGFSLLTNNKSSDKQKKNRSLVASFASFVDFYRPKFGILENVINIVQSSERKSAESAVGQDYFSQLICAVVGLGYQAQIILGDAWTYGAPQSRERVFLFFALPGHRLPEPPMPSHTHPADIKGRDLGKMSNGEPYVKRQFPPAAFRFTTAGEAIADLPPIQDGKTDICIPFPDHRCAALTERETNRVKLIPTNPYGIGFAKAWADGRLTPAEREVFGKPSLRTSAGSKAWSRIDPNKLFATVTTCPQHTDARTGRALHPREPRTVSVQELRRAQGIPDHEVLMGSLRDRWKMVGNSVARQIALALGLELRRALCGTLYDVGTVPASVPEPAVHPAVAADSAANCGSHHGRNGALEEEDEQDLKLSPLQQSSSSSSHRRQESSKEAEKTLPKTPLNGGTSAGTSVAMAVRASSSSSSSRPPAAVRASVENSSSPTRSSGLLAEIGAVFGSGAHDGGSSTGSGVNHGGALVNGNGNGVGVGAATAAAAAPSSSTETTTFTTMMVNTTKVTTNMTTSAAAATSSAAPTSSSTTSAQKKRGARDEPIVIEDSSGDDGDSDNDDDDDDDDDDDGDGDDDDDDDDVVVSRKRPRLQSPEMSSWV